MFIVEQTDVIVKINQQCTGIRREAFSRVTSTNYEGG